MKESQKSPDEIDDFAPTQLDERVRFFHQLPEAIEAREAWEALSPEERKRLQTEAWGSVQEAMKRMPRVTMADVKKRMQEARRFYRKLAIWLDQQPVTCPACSHRYPAGAWNGKRHSCPDCGELYWIGLAVR